MGTVDRDRFSAIGHRKFKHCNPMPEDKIENVLDQCRLPSGSRVLDLGCGKAEILIRLVERYSVHGVGVERSRFLLTEAIQSADDRIASESLTLHHEDVRAFPIDGRSYDMTICVGVSELFGSHAETLRRIASYTKLGGITLFGTTYWLREPDADYLDLMEVGRDWCNDYGGTIQLGIKEGLTPLYVRTASTDDWDKYEWQYRRSMFEYLQAHPKEECHEAFAERNRRGLDIFLRGGREFLGFGLFLFGV